MKKRRFFEVTLLIGLTAYYFAEALFFNSVLSFRDLSRYFYPLRLFTANCVKSGIVPLWNPYIFCGTPHLALQQSVIFYPLSAIYYIFPFDRAFNIFLVAHILLAGLFVFLLSLRWRFNDGAALVAAITFMFSGYLVSVMNLATTLSSVIWLPAVLLFFDKGLSEGRVRHILVSSLFLAVVFLGGEPSIFYSTLWVILFYALFFRLNSRCDLKRAAFYFVLASATGVLIASVQLIPFLELMHLADRTLSSAPYEYVTKWSLPLKDTFSFFIPYLARTDFSKASYWKEQNWAILIYAGVFPSILMLIAWLFKKDWRVKFLTWTGLFFLLVSYGSNTPFYYFLYKFLPGFRYVRYPARFLYFTTFAISMLSGAGLDAYIEGRKASDEKLRLFFKYVLIALYLFSLLFLALHIYRNELIALAHKFCARHFNPETEGGVLFSFIGAIFNFKRFFGFLVTGGLLLYLGLKVRGLRQGALSFAFIALMIADLFSVWPQTNLAMDSKAIRAATGNIEALKKDNSLFRFFVSPKTRESGDFLRGRSYEEGIQKTKDALTANWPMVYGLYDVSGYDSIRLLDYSNLMMLVDTSGSPDATRVLDMLNSKYLGIMNETDSKSYRLVNKGAIYLYENLNVLPRAFLADSFKVLKKEGEVADRFRSKEFDPAKEVILREEPRLVNSLQLTVYSKVPEKVEITKYTPNEVAIKALVKSPKFLVLADTYYPGWKVYVDGRRDRIYPADYVLRAVHLNAGAHTVIFRFEPFSFRIGLGLSLGTLLVMLFLFVYKRI